MRRLLSILLVVVMVLSLGACGGSGGLSNGDELKSFELDIFKINNEKQYFLGTNIEHEWYFDVEFPKGESLSDNVSKVKVTGTIVDTDNNLESFTVEVLKIEDIEIIETKSEEEVKKDAEHDKTFYARMNEEESVRTTIEGKISESEQDEIISSVAVASDGFKSIITIDLKEDVDVLVGNISNLRNVACDAPIQYAKNNGYE